MLSLSQLSIKLQTHPWAHLCCLHFILLADGLNLVGAAIGNGVMDYLKQEASYAEYAYFHGLIPYAAKQRFDYDWEVCKTKVSRLMHWFLSCIS